MLYFFISFIVATRGGILTPATSCFPVVSIVGFVVIGSWGGIVFGSLSVISVIVIFTLEKNGVDMGTVSGGPATALVVYSTSFICSILLLVVYSRMNSEFQKRLNTSTEKMERDEKQKVIILDQTKNVMTAVSSGDLSEKIISDCDGFEKSHQ